MDQLDIFVEFFKDVDYDSLNAVKVTPSDEVKNIRDFYDKVQKLPFNVRKFSFEIRNSLNGCPLEFRDFPVDQDDSLEFEYRFRDLGPVSKAIYMDFLHNAYKEDELLLSSLSVGNWISYKFNMSPM